MKYVRLVQLGGKRTLSFGLQMLITTDDKIKKQHFNVGTVYVHFREANIVFLLFKDG